MECYLQHTINDFISLDSSLCVQCVAPLQTLALFSQRTTNSQLMLHDSGCSTLSKKVVAHMLEWCDKVCYPLRPCKYLCTKVTIFQILFPWTATEAPTFKFLMQNVVLLLVTYVCIYSYVCVCIVYMCIQNIQFTNCLGKTLHTTAGFLISFCLVKYLFK